MIRGGGSRRGDDLTRQADGIHRQPPVTPRRHARRLAGGVGLAGMIGSLVIHLSAAAFTASTNTAVSLSSAPCFFGATTQGGTTTSTTNGVTSVTISAVTLSRAFLVFSLTSNSNRPVGSEVRGDLGSPTRIDFTRDTNESSPATISIQWYVVEYACGVSVQRGTATLSGTVQNVSITPVNALAAAFVTASKTAASTGNAWGSNDTFALELTNVSNLQIRTDATASNHKVAWQVIEFTDPTKVRVQHGSTSLAASSSSTTATLPTAVDPTKTFVLTAARSSPSGNDAGSSLIRAQLTNSTTVTFDRGASNYPITEITWQTIELLDGSSVQAGSAAFGAGVGTVTAPIVAVTVGRSTTFASGQTGAGQSGGRMTYTTDDIIGAGSATVALTSSTQVTLTRAATLGTADVEWFVVSWGLPS